MSRQWILIISAILGFVNIAEAGRPLSTNDAGTLDKGRWELELAAEYLHESECRHWNVPAALTYGLVDRMEVGIGFGGQFEDHDLTGGQTSFEESLSDITIGFKWHILDRNTAYFDHALAGQIKIPVAANSKGMGSGEFDYDLTWISSRPINDQFDFLFNIGLTWFGHGDEEVSNVLHYGAAITWQLTERLQPVVEILVETPIEGGKSSAGALVGLRYQITEDVMLDFGMGVRVAGDWPDWITTVGMTWGL